MPTSANNPYFQVGLDVLGRRCLVVGGNDEAADKSQRLVEAGAEVVVISREVTDPISRAATRGQLTWEGRDLEIETDLDETFLVMNTLHEDADLVKRLHEACRKHRVLLNTYDRPEQSDFGMAALVRRGHLRISISSSNASPTLSGHLRRQLEAAFDDEFVAYLEELGTARRKLRERVVDGPTRRSKARALVDGFRFTAAVELPGDWRQRLAAAIP